MAGLFKTFRSRLAETEYRKKLVHTLCHFFTFVVVGICNAQTGPALLDLQIITNTDTQQSSLFFTGRSIGSLIGCVLVGFICARLNKAILMSAILLAAAVSVTAIPWCSPYVLMIVMHGVMGVLTASISAGGNTELIRIWETERRVFIQILHFCYAIGSTLGPVITQPFLAPRLGASVCNSSVQKLSTITYSDAVNLITPVISENDSEINKECKERSPVTKVHYAYLVTGVFFLIGFIIFIMQHCCFTYKEKTATMPVPTSDQTQRKEMPLPVYVMTVTFLLLLLFFIIAVETSVSSYLLTFVVKQLNWTKEAGADLTSIFWGCYTIWRFAAIFFTNYISPFILLIISSCLLLLSSVGILLSSIYQNAIGIWICVGISGLSLSPQYTSTMMWSEESIIRLTPQIISLIVMACALPGMVSPLLIGYLMKEESPLWLFYLTIIMCGTCLLLLLSLYSWTKCVIQPKVTGIKTTDEEETENDS